MNRKNFLSTAAALGALSVPASVAGSLLAAETKTAAKTNAAANAAAPLLFGTPVAGAPENDAFTVVTALNAPALLRVEYGEAGAAETLPDDPAELRKRLDKTAANDDWGFVPHDDKIAQIRVPNLRPGTRYFWRIAAIPLAAGGKVNAPVSFSKTYATRTLDPAAAETRFTVWNDTHERTATIRALHAATRNPHASDSTAKNPARGDANAIPHSDDFLLWNGDLSNNIDRRPQLPGIFVSPEGSDLAELPPLFITRGNHDVRGIWSNKVPEYTAFPARRPYYAFRSGPVAAVALDTGEDKPDSHPSFKGVAAFDSLIREQAAWLAAVIQRPEFRDAPYRVVFCHIPLRWLRERPPNYNKGGYDDFSRRGRDAWGDILKRWGAQVIVSGHMHHAANLPATSEYPFAQIVGGGPSLAATPKGATLIRAHANSTRLSFSTFSVANLSANPLFKIEFPPLP